MWIVVAGVLFSALGLSLVVAWIAAHRSSWRLMLLAMLISLVFSWATGFSVGLYTLLLTNLMLASALGLRWHFQYSGWALTLIAAAAIWFLVVPANLLVFHWPLLTLLEQFALLIVIVATLIGPRRILHAQS